MGTASFLRKQDVRLPSNINLKTGIFLAIDHQLAAVFAVKYEASEMWITRCGPCAAADHADSGGAGPQHHPGAAEAEIL